MRALSIVALLAGAAGAARANGPHAATETVAPTNPVEMYNLACKKALAGDRDGAFAWLDKAVASGFGALPTIEADTDLTSLHGDARWKALLGKVKAANEPCRALPEARQLDFWVGEWDVRDPAGHLVGRSSIQLIVNDCVVLENWTGSLGGTGKSMNFWDKAHRRWQQTWVDNRGNVLQYTGTLVGDSLRYAAEGNRLTFSPLPGHKVRQLAEQSADGGKSWTTSYDFTYSPHAGK
jgi:hypothetical protein